jgi:mono/diheme cytochrome c family protein
VDSLEPPPNPNKFDQRAAAGKKIFDSQCSGCHTPPYYTSGKLTLAVGFTPPGEVLATAEFPRAPGLAMQRGRIIPAAGTRPLGTPSPITMQAARH